MPESLTPFLILSAGVLGLLVGSFLNVCIFRLPRSCMSIVKPRSRCPRCLAGIAWYDNFPVVSWVLLLGKCRHCGVRISPRYALVELLTAALFAGAAWSQLAASRPDSERAILFVVQAYLAGALVVCCFIDIEFRILPDEITFSGIFLGIACGAAFPFIHGKLPAPAWGGFLNQPHVMGAICSALGALVGGGTIYAVGVLGKLLFRKEAMGLGDVKFMAFLGGFLGWRGALLTFVLGCVAGVVYWIGRCLVTLRIRGGYVPFGPFLVVGALTMIYFAPWVDRGIDAYLRWTQPIVQDLLGG